MSILAQAQAIGGRFDAQWPVNNPVSPTPEIAWPNVHFEPPTNAPWVRYTLKTGEEVLSAGQPSGGLYSNGGVIFINVYTPKETNAQQAIELADHAAGIYRGQVFSDVEIYNISVSEGMPEDAWYSMNVQVQFKYRQIYTIS